MTTMTLAEALDVVVAATGHARYRDLCDPANPAYDPRFVPIVLGLAGAGAGAKPRVALGVRTPPPGGT